MGDIGRKLLIIVKTAQFLLKILSTGFCLLFLSLPARAELIQSQLQNQLRMTGTNTYKAVMLIREIPATSKIFMEIGTGGIADSPPINVIEGKITDPNFNVMRNDATRKSTATALVVGCLVIATVVPLATWWYFTR